MVQNNPTNVFAAFEMLLEEMEIEIGCIDKAGAKAFESRDDENVHETAERGKKAIALRDRVVELRRD